MEPRARSLLVLTLLAIHLWPSALSDFATSCSTCSCKWTSGDKAADCSSKGFSQVPDELSEEIQNLNLSGNSLYELPHSVFQNVGLSNLKKLFLKMCNIISVHKHAFKNLKIIIEIDLSNNDIKTLYPETFEETEKIRVILLNNNRIEKIEDGLFKNLIHLQRIDLNNNRIFKLGLKPFVRVPTLKNLGLAYNNLTHVRLETFSSLNLTSLDLHDNPWKCDCNMQTFRDWVIDRNLCTIQSTCMEPPQLHRRTWSSTKSTDFACKPAVLEPFITTLDQSVGDNITLSCKYDGNPTPEANWLQNSRIIEGESKKHGDHRFSIKRSYNELSLWINLTISQLRYFDRGEYKCIVKNPGGVDEKSLMLGVNRNPGGAGSGIAASDIMALVIGITVGAILLMFLIAVLCFCFCKKRGNKRHLKSDMHSSNGEALIEGSIIPEMEKSLITTVNPVTKPPRIYDAPASVMSGATEMSELNKTLLDSDSVFAANEDESRCLDYTEQVKRSRENLLGDRSHSGPFSSNPPRPSPRAYPPDLLSFPPRAIQTSPISSTSNEPNPKHLNQTHSPIHSPIYGTNPNLFRTLPHSRSQSPFTSPVCPPAITPRQGYVTIPRRPRVPSWSSTTSTVTPGPQVEFFDPVYDNLGLRTSANGSSALSLNKAGLDHPFSPMRNRPLPATPISHQEPVMYTPIAEHERAPSPAPSTPHNNSTLPRVNSSPFRLQLSPTIPEPQETLRRRQRVSPETGILKKFTPIESAERQSPSPFLTNSKIYDTISNNDTLGRSGKIPPRPPPKPKKKSPTESSGPLFEDEGEDGTEV